jgi:hypothetical protein
MKQITEEYRLWHGILALLRSKRQHELAEVLTRDVDRTAAKHSDMRIRKDDLATLGQFLRIPADIISGEHVAPPPPPGFFRSVARLVESKPAVPRRLKPEYLEAYRRKQAARAQGRNLTAETLARELLPKRYERNPESAIRSMQRGLKRVELRTKTSAHFSDGEPQNSQ